MSRPDIVVIEPTPELIKKARDMATESPFNGNTMVRESQRGQLAGNIVELAFKDWLDSFCLENSYVAQEKDYFDFIVGNRRIDTKGKRRTVRYRPQHEAHIETRLNQTPKVCDHYVFGSIVVPKGATEPQYIELVGFIPVDKFWSHPQLRIVKKGDKSPGGFTEHANAGKLWYQHLSGMSELKEKIELHLYQLAFA